ncbi:MAG: hypothetical protein Fur0035_23970 [Anaerolineales bacterium]
MADTFGAPRQLTPGQQDAMPTGLALQPNIRADAGDEPLIAAAGMRFPHTHKVIGKQVWQHGCGQDYTVFACAPFDV